MNNRGHSGTPVRVKTNAFKITRLPTRNYHHYHVDANISAVLVVIVQKNVRDRESGTNKDKQLQHGQRYTEIIDKMHVQYPQEFVTRASYDGLYNLYSPRHMQAATQFEVTLNGPKGRPSIFHVQLTHVAVIDTSIFSRLTSPDGAFEAISKRPDDSATAINLLQVLVSQSPHIRHNFSLHAKSFYNASQPGGVRDIVRGLQAVSGYFQSVRPVLGNFIVNVDTTTAAFYKPDRLVTAAMSYLDPRLKDIRVFIGMCRDRRQFERLRRFFKGVAVIVRGGRRRVIRDLIEEAGIYEFEKGDRPISVAEHYREMYHEELHRPWLFGIKCDGGDVFPAEFCSVAPGQRYKKKLDPDQTAEFLKISVKDPGPRLQAILGAVNGPLLGYRDSPWMLEANMEVDVRPLEIDARQLPAPAVKYNGSYADTTRVAGAWNVVGKKLYAPVTVSSWAVVNFDSAQSQPADITKFIHMMSNNMFALGMVVPDPRQISVGIGNIHNPNQSLEDARIRMGSDIPADKRNLFMKAAFIIVILPASALELRKMVKYWGDVVQGMATQCVRAPKYKTNLNDQYCNNVALKINAKLGGVNSLPDSQDIRAMLEGAMVVGCDVSHPAPNIKDRPSLASVVTSYNSTATKYRVYLDCQAPRQEIIDRIAAMLHYALRAYRDYNKKLPHTMIVYRDGVSEGEYWQVMDREIGQIKGGSSAAIDPSVIALITTVAMIQGEFGNQVQVVFIAVGKRHHIRFFPTTSQGRDKKGNCLPGLVVDSGVVHSSLPDFYLQSHAGLIGTSRPSHYVVLHNDPQWTVDSLQMLSYHLCYFYAVATRAVSIPAPVYYADRACTRAAYQFDPTGRFDYDHDSNTDGAGTFNETNLKEWRAALKQSLQSERLYFV
ncbi:hypothetical protein PHLGIDRAFT_125630 [Phlebiopsis gigantea 11061_1 CR5-6]|uniref:Piwi domain-containing protein n=1 Tax=Phlebiopsis gigantea (strain 11061_1 CR5-6) TaxID=745531 RepID=A0A0C3PSD6_PHLG1|nr:hypothetical protein PHLGIDRAFT_125630 [Phlebiopsis gigantea 11061_1 CR5-6]